MQGDERHIILFSVTYGPDRIDLSRTSARAVIDLKHFLEYAERGSSILGAAVHGSMGDFDSPFESAIARALRDKIRQNVLENLGIARLSQFARERIIEGVGRLS